MKTSKSTLLTIFLVVANLCVLKAQNNEALYLYYGAASVPDNRLPEFKHNGRSVTSVFLSSSHSGLYGIDLNMWQLVEGHASSLLFYVNFPSFSTVIPVIGNQPLSQLRFPTSWIMDGFFGAHGTGFSGGTVTAAIAVCPAHAPTVRPLGKTIFTKTETILLEAGYTNPHYVDADFVWQISFDGTTWRNFGAGKKFPVTYSSISSHSLYRSGATVFFRLRYCDFIPGNPPVPFGGSPSVSFRLVDESEWFLNNLHTATVNCPNEAPQPLFLQFNRSFDASITITNAYLFQAADGSRPSFREDLRFSVDTNGITVEFDNVLPDGNYFLQMEGHRSGTALSFLSTSVRIINPQPLNFEKTVSPSSGIEYHDGVPNIIADGKIKFSIKNYLNNFSIFWNGEHHISETTFSNLTPGVYSAKIFYNSDRCEIPVSTTVECSNRSLKVQIVAGMPISCEGRSDASLQAFIERTPAVGAISFSWYKNENLLPNETQLFLENLSAGNYFVVGESEGLRSTFSFSVAEPQLLELTVKSIIHPFCGNSGGQIHIVANGGTLPYRYVWSTGQESEFIDQLTGGIYSYMVHDAHSCEVSGSIELFSPKPLEITVVEQIEQSYFGSELGVIKPSENTGLIRVLAEFGTPPYDFQWSNGATSSVLTNLSFGVFHLTVNDFYSCEQTLTVELPQRFPLTVTIEKLAHINCFESNDAILQASFEGGIPPYTYRWTHSNDTVLRQVELGIGTYEFEVIDSRGVRSFDRVYVSQPEPLHIVLSADSVSGWGASDGSVHAVASGGTPPYTFEWGCSTAASVANLRAGTYRLRLADVNGCWLEDSVVIGSPDSLTLVGQVYHCTYFGAIQGVSPIEPNDGRIDCQVEGGVKPYIYQWFYQTASNEWVQLLSKNSPYIDSLTGGRYALLVTDSKGYSVSDTFEVIKTKPLIASILGTSPLCFGDFDGTLQTLVTGGTPPYSYQWNLGDSTALLQNLTIGHYTVVVQDSIGVQSTFELTLTQPEPLTINYVINEITKHEGNNGAIFTVAQGGTKPYSYLWTYLDTICYNPQISNLSSGIYTFQITDFNGCLWSTSFAMNNPDALEISALIKPMSYLGSVQGRVAEQSADGEIYLTVSGGFPPYDFFWSNNEKTSYLTGLSNGSYAVTVVDKYGNEAFGVFDIKSTEPLMLTVNQNSLIACFGDSTARLTSHIFGGTPPYTFLWNTGATTTSIDSIPSGEYHLTVTDRLDVAANFTIRVNEPAPLSVFENVTQPQCPSPVNGTIRIFVSGGMPAYQYLWNTGEQISQLQRLSDGVYDVTISDANGCRQNRSFVLQTPLTARIQQHDFIRCFGDSNATLELTICGGFPPYKVLWNTGDSTLFLYEQKGGLYSVTVTDSVGTIYTTEIEVFEPFWLSVSGTSTNPSCFGVNDGSVEITAEGGTFPYLYRWSNMTTLPQLTNLSGGDYSLSVTDRNGCQATYSTTLVEPEKLLVNLGFDRTLCQGQVISIVLPNDNLVYSWQKNGSFFYVGNSVELFEAGEYTVIAEDKTGCKTFDTLRIGTVNDHLIAEFWHSHEALIGEDFVVANIGQTAYDYVTWSVTPNVQIVSQNNEYLILRFSEIREYEIRLTVHKNNCFDEQTGLVQVLSQHENLRLKSANVLSLSDLKIFPNPANEQFSFSVQAKESTNLHWTLTHATTGSVVLFGQTKADSNGVANQQISLQKQPRGIYIFRVFSGKEHLSSQLIIQ